MNLYKAKRVLRSPVTWWMKRSHQGEYADEGWRLDHQAWRRSALKATGNVAVDRHFYYRADLGPDSVIIDVGAWRGEVAQTLTDLYGARIYSFEPEPAFYADLERTFADNPKVSTYGYGLGARDETLLLEQDGQGSTVHGKLDGTNPTVEVQIRDIAAVLDELGIDHIDYIKINIEGAEFDLLERMAETGWLERTRYLLIQFHEWYDDADLRRWKLRRRFRATHEEVWNYPWIYELWCAKSAPHPPPPVFTAEEMVEIRAALRRQRLGEDAPKP